MERCPLTSGHEAARHFHLPVLLALWVMWPLQAQSLYIHREEYATNQDDTESTAADMQPTLSWAIKFRVSTHRRVVQRTDFDEIAERFAGDVRLLNHGQVGELLNHYLFVHPSYNQTLNGTSERTTLTKIQEETEALLRAHPDVEWFHQQRIRRRTKRSVKFNDPSYSLQWHLHNHKSPGMDINVTEVWQHNITGTGVVVAVIDDGLEWKNEDILDNYNARGSWDLNSNDPDPMPEVHKGDGKSLNRHGTRCAGEIAAVANDKCSVGVAYDAQISGIRLLDGPMTDSLEATAFNKNMHINDIYSCSWGPDDDGKTVDGPHPLAQQALKHGVTVGRKGLGSIFVVASGNGGRNEDNCNYDGYANSMYTVTIGAVDESGQMPYYAEQCASMLAVTFSSGASNKRNIVTTDWTLAKGTGCTSSHTGTSAAAPLAAGMIALMIQAKPCLTWRDVQHIIVYTATKVDEKNAVWITNAGGFHHSHKHGFGLMSAWRLVNAAKSWHTVPWLSSIDGTLKLVNQPILAGKTLTVVQTVPPQTAEDFELTSLEHVLVTVSLTHVKRGKLQVQLICPSGTQSVIGARRKKDDSSEGLKSWTFSSVRCWGESPVGDWKLVITDNHENFEALNVNKGTLQSWKLTLYGSSMNKTDIEKRKVLVSEAMSGIFLDANMTEPCSYYLNTGYEEENYLSAKAMEILLYVSGVFTLMAVYYTLEQALCNPEDKEKQKDEEEEEAEAAARERGLQDREERGDGEERTRLLEDVHLNLRAEDEAHPYQPRRGSQEALPQTDKRGESSLRGKRAPRSKPPRGRRREEARVLGLTDSRRLPGMAVPLARGDGDGDSDHAVSLSPHPANCEELPPASHTTSDVGVPRLQLPPVTFDSASVTAETHCLGCQRNNPVQYEKRSDEQPANIREVDQKIVPAPLELPPQLTLPSCTADAHSNPLPSGALSISRAMGCSQDAPTVPLKCDVPSTLTDSTDLPTGMATPSDLVVPTSSLAAPSAQTRSIPVAASLLVTPADQALSQPITDELLSSAMVAMDQPSTSRDLIGPFEPLRDDDKSARNQVQECETGQANWTSA